MKRLLGAVLISLVFSSAFTQQQTSSATTLYFPDFVDGGGWSVQLVLSNTSADSDDAAVVVQVYDSVGDSVHRFFGSDNSLTIPAQGSRVLRSPGSGAIRRGWIEVESDSTSVSGLLTYRNAQSGLEVGVQPVPLGDHFALFVEESSDIGTGLAIFKPDASPAIEMRLRDEDGYNPLGGGRFITWWGFRQSAKTLLEWITVEGVDTAFLRDFRGLLFLRSEDGSSFAPLGIRFGKRQGQGSLSAVPVISIEEDLEDADFLDDFNVQASSSDRSLQICVRDHECEDGDRISVYVGGTTLFSNVKLFNEWNCKTIRIPGSDSSYSTPVRLVAENGTGFEGLCSYRNVNTGEIRISGTTTETQSWKHKGGYGSQATLHIRFVD